MCMHVLHVLDVLLDLDMHVPAPQFVFWPDVFSTSKAKCHGYHGLRPFSSTTSAILIEKCMKMHSSAIFGIVFCGIIFFHFPFKPTNKETNLRCSSLLLALFFLSSKLLGWSISAGEHPCLRIWLQSLPTKKTLEVFNQNTLFYCKFV